MTLVNPTAPIKPKDFANMYKENLTGGMTSEDAFNAVFKICGKRWLFTKDGQVSKFYTEWWEATQLRCAAILGRHLGKGIKNSKD